MTNVDTADTTAGEAATPSTLVAIALKTLLAPSRSIRLSCLTTYTAKPLLQALR